MYLKTLSVLLLLSTLTGCSIFQSKDEVDASYKYEVSSIQDRPRPLELESVNFKVVTEETLEEAHNEYQILPSGEFVYIAMSVKDYENLALNVNDITRYIEQLLSLLSYYETIITDTESKGTQSDGRREQ